jgi:hypothetical protein
MKPILTDNTQTKIYPLQARTRQSANRVPAVLSRIDYRRIVAEILG